MKTAIEFLRKAADFSILSETTFEFNFNEHRGGSFEEIMPEKAFAYGVEWNIKLNWIDKAWGDYCYDYYSEFEPTLPTKILIEQLHSSMPQWQDTTEEVRFFGKPIFKQSDDWGRKSVIWLSRFKKELELCENEEQVLRKIKEIQNREYYNGKKSKLVDSGFSEPQIKKFFRCKCYWKYELLELKLHLANSTAYPKSVFKELSEARSNYEFNTLAKNWGLAELCGFSHPRKTSYSSLIYALK